MIDLQHSLEFNSLTGTVGSIFTGKINSTKIGVEFNGPVENIYYAIQRPTTGIILS